MLPQLSQQLQELRSPQIHALLDYMQPFLQHIMDIQAQVPIMPLQIAIVLSLIGIFGYLVRSKRPDKSEIHSRRRTIHD